MAHILFFGEIQLLSTKKKNFRVLILLYFTISKLTFIINLLTKIDDTKFYIYCHMVINRKRNGNQIECIQLTEQVNNSIIIV